MSGLKGKLLSAPVIISGLYFLAIMPRMRGKPDMTPLDAKLFAHRGLFDNRTGAPENSMAAFRKAVEAGYGIELDVQLTADNVPVIFHDFSLLRACGTEGLVRDYTFDELQQFRLFGSDERIPPLAEFLEMVDGKVPLIVEYKSEDTDMTICRIVDPILKRYKGPYVIESFNPLVLGWYRLHRPYICRGQLSDGFLHDPKYQTWRKAPVMFPFQFLLANFLSKPDFIAYNHLYKKNLSRSLCRDLFRVRSAAWTIRSEKQLTKAEPHFDVFIFDGFIPENTTHK